MRMSRVLAVLLVVFVLAGALYVYAWTDTIEQLFSNVEYLGNDGWYWSNSFGYFIDLDDNWIYHPEHGYLYCSGYSETGIWIYDYDDASWIWTRDDIYPACYSLSEMRWTSFVGGRTVSL